MIERDVSAGGVAVQGPHSKALYTIARAGNSNCRHQGILIVASHQSQFSASNNCKNPNHHFYGI